MVGLELDKLMEKIGRKKKGKNTLRGLMKKSVEE